MRWTVFPVRDNPRKGIIVILFLVMLLVGIYLYYGLFWALLSSVILVGSLLQFFTPTTYVLLDDGVEVRSLYVQRRRWEDVKRFYIDKRGVFLSPFAKPSRLENFRGVYLRFPEDKELRERIVEFVKTHCSQSE